MLQCRIFVDSWFKRFKLGFMLQRSTLRKTRNRPRAARLTDTNTLPILRKNQMNFALPEQITSTQKSQLKLATACAQVLFTTAEQVAPLTLDTLRGAITEAATVAGTLPAAKAPQDLVALYGGLSEATLEVSVGYARSVFDIASSAHAQLAKLFEAHAAEFQQGLVSSVEAAAKNAPAGSETAVAAFKQMMTAATAGYDSASKASKQVTDLAMANVAAATEAGRKATAAVSRKGKVS
jgi:phasin family protein